VKRVNLENRSTIDLAARCSRTSGDRWRGFVLHEERSEPEGELPEGYVVAHALVLVTNPPRHQWEFYAPGAGWKKFGPVFNSLLFLPMHAPHAARWQGGCHAIGIELSPQFFGSVREPGRKTLPEMPARPLAHDELIIQTVLALWRDVRAGSPTGTLYGEHLGAALVSQLLTHCGDSIATNESHGQSCVRLKNVIEHINDCLSDDLSLASLAELARVGIEQFIRLFKDETGLTPHQYVLRRRIERAQTLLAHQRVPLTEVALQVGFSDYSHFSKMFARITGINPKMYRDRLSD